MHDEYEYVERRAPAALEPLPDNLSVDLSDIAAQNK